MIWLLKMIIFGHVHKWKEIERRKLTMGRNVGTVVLTECETCGAHRKWELI